MSATIYRVFLHPLQLGRMRSLVSEDLARLRARHADAPSSEERALYADRVREAEELLSSLLRHEAVLDVGRAP